MDFLHYGEHFLREIRRRLSWNTRYIFFPKNMLPEEKRVEKTWAIFWICCSLEEGGDETSHSLVLH